MTASQSASCPHVIGEVDASVKTEGNYNDQYDTLSSFFKSHEFLCLWDKGSFFFSAYHIDKSRILKTE